MQVIYKENEHETKLIITLFELNKNVRFASS